jgi:hypothetical protein
MFYSDRDRYIDVMRHAIALNASFFNTERMVDQYVRKAYFALRALLVARRSGHAGGRAGSRRARPAVRGSA